ncbi:MAG: aldo/keto reductase [bacterium]
MEKRSLGRTDIKVSALCLGTMMYGDQISEADAQAQMDKCFERGINFYDTAELYTIPPKPETQGNSERIVGRWIKERGNRDKIILATKVVGRTLMNWFRDNDEECRLNKKQIKTALERSLKNLQTDYVDLYQTHWPDRTVFGFGSSLRGFRFKPDEEPVDIDETLEAFDELIQEGKVRHMGLSNETAWGVMRHLDGANNRGLPRVVSIQNCYNLLTRGFETDLAEIAMREQVGLLAYSPIAQGALSGKYLKGQKPKGSRGEMFGRLDRYETPGTDPAIEQYVALAKDFGHDPAALAMQFVTTRPFVTSNIFGANGMAQLETIFASLDIEMTRELEKAISEIYIRWPNPCQ